VESQLCLFSFLNHNDDETLGLFSVMIGDSVLITEINESITPWTESLRTDVTNFICSAGFIQIFLVVDFSINDHFSLADYMYLSTSDSCLKSFSIWNDIDLDVWVQLL